jgi:kynurenine formamidase
VLVDFLSYARKHNIPYNPLEHHAIPLQTVLTILADANVALREGDILLLRTGFTHAFASSSPAIQASIMAKRPFEYPGIESNTKVLEWLWDTGIAAVAGDCPGFEAWPPSEEAMHQVLLAGFGMPIGELFDFEGLAEECGREGRWTFFFSSEPLNVKGGVGSPPNALAIF